MLPPERQTFKFVAREIQVGRGFSIIANAATIGFFARATIHFRCRPASGHWLCYFRRPGPVVKCNAGAESTNRPDADDGGPSCSVRILQQLGGSPKYIPSAGT
jgi:hypothetical protein